ncbi:MAG: sulfurtransferase-like selenium metabolism protein YedF [Cellulosilyticaceae bacterium]
MKQIIDARGQACPIPVVETKKVLGILGVGDAVEVAVDNAIAVENLTKMASQKGLEVGAEKIDENHYVVTLTVPVSAQQEVSEKAALHKTVVVLASDRMGEGDDKLGHLLMKGFIYALTEQDELPETIVLYNRGAYLSTESSDSIADLKLLQAQGVEILTCGTCLNHYGLSEKLAVGAVTNMYVILEKQMQAAKIVRP